MKNGSYTYFTIQFQLSHETKEYYPDGKIFPVSSSEWNECGDYWVLSIVPCIYRGNNHIPKNKKLRDEWRRVRYITDSFGWWSIKPALAAVKRLERDSEKGMYDVYSGDGHLEQRQRFKFRVVKVEMIYNKNEFPVKKELE